MQRLRTAGFILTSCFHGYSKERAADFRKKMTDFRKTGKIRFFLL